MFSHSQVSPPLPLLALIDFTLVIYVFQVRCRQSLESSSRHPRPPFCRTACERRMLSEAGLAALCIIPSSRGMTALWCSLWLSFLLPLSVAPARLPTAPPTGRRQYQSLGCTVVSSMHILKQQAKKRIK